jgi:hypothetical protein
VHERRADRVIDDGLLAVERGRVGVPEAAVAEHRSAAAREVVAEAHVERHLGVVDVQRLLDVNYISPLTTITSPQLLPRPAALPLRSLPSPRS